jgi:hypothetical protein
VQAAFPYNGNTNPSADSYASQTLMERIKAIDWTSENGGGRLTVNRKKDEN